jgi:hypothetical protein
MTKKHKKIMIHFSMRHTIFNLFKVNSILFRKKGIKILFFISKI